MAALKRSHSSRPRNPIIADVSFKGGYIDAWRRGTIKVLDTCRQADLPEPEMKEQDGGFIITLFKDNLTEEQLTKLGLNDRQLKAIFFVKEKKAAFRLGKLTPPFIKLLCATSVAAAAGAIGADKTYLNHLLAIDTGMVGPLFNTLASVFASQSYDCYKDLINRKDYGFEGDLQKAYQAALKLTFHTLQEKCLQEYPDINPSRVETFFENLEDDYIQLQGSTSEAVAPEILEAYV